MDDIPPSLAVGARNCHLAAMLDWLFTIWDFHFWTAMTAIGALVAAISIWADRQRERRKRIEQVGFMPWTGISLLAVGVSLISLALAIKSG